MVWRLLFGVVEIGVELWWLWKIGMEFCVCGSIVGFDGGSISGFAFGLMMVVLGYMGGGNVFTMLLWLFGSCLVVREK